MNWSLLVAYTLSTAGFIVLVGGACVLINTKLIRPFKELLFNFRFILDFINGKEAVVKNNYVLQQRMPGIVEQVRVLQQTQNVILQHLNTISHEVLPNNGSSMRDDISRIHLATVPVEG